MDDNTGEKLGYIQAKLEAIHEDLTTHISEESSRFDSLEERIDSIEDTHASWKTMYRTVKVTIFGFIAVVAYQWSVIIDNFKSIFKH